MKKSIFADASVYHFNCLNGKMGNLQSLILYGRSICGLQGFEEINRISIDKQKVRLRPTKIRRLTFYHIQLFICRREGLFFRGR